MIALTTAMMIWIPNLALKFHGKWFGLDESALKKVYFQYLAIYKILIIGRNLASRFHLKYILKPTHF